MDIEELIKDPEYSNFVCVYMGLTFVGQCLEAYTRNGLQQVHQEIKTSLVGNASCTCVATGNSVSSWCKSCQDWRKMLITFHVHRCKDVEWTDQDRLKWPSEYEAIANIFVKAPGTSVRSVNLRDLSTVCSIWKRCKVFKLNKHYLKNVNCHRNNLFAHNDTLRITNNDKAKVFDSLKDLVKEKDVQPFIDRQECLNELEKIEKSDKQLRESINHFYSSTTSVEGNKQVLENLTKTLHEMIGQTKLLKYNQEDSIKAQQNMHEIVTLLSEKQSRESIDMNYNQNIMLSILRAINERTKKISVVLCAVFAIVLCVVVLLIKVLNKSDTVLDNYLNMDSDDTTKNSGHLYSKCLSEAFTYPFRQDLPLLGYLPTQNELIGREWALETLEQNLVTENTNSRGILMTADYGFGKSAIVAHLLCVGKKMKGWKIRKHIVAFHVCKFNVGITKSPARLIRRIIGFLSMKSAEYGQLIALHEHSLMFKESDCEKNIDACFDQAITIPLETLTIPDDAPWIIAIDALDECQEPSGDNRILKLLSKRLILVQQSGRKWLKWLVTSRQMSDLKTIHKLDFANFESSDKRNIDDIYQLVINYLPSDHNYLNLAKSFAVNSGGNMLYVRHALEYAIQSTNFSLLNLLKLPNTMDEVYELNFNRLFEHNDDFQIAKPLLEIICTGKTLDMHHILEALKENRINLTHFEKVKDKLSFFILTDDLVTFRHRSLYDWLKGNIKYKVSIEQGHAMMSNYLFNFNSPQENLDERLFLWVLADHVTKSGDKHLYHKFISSNFTNFQSAKQILNQQGGVKYFFYGKSKTSLKSYELIFDFISKSFHGDIAYDLSKHIYHISRDNSDIFKFLYKKVAHLEHRFLLHGAANHCREEIAQYLIVEANLSVFSEDFQGRRPSDIACSNGCFNVLKVIAKKDHSVLNMQCLFRALNSGEHIFNKMFLSSLEFDLSCGQKTHKDFERTYFSYMLFVKECRCVDIIFEHLQAFFENSVLHVLVYSHSASYKLATHVRKSVTLRTFVNKYSDILSCPDLQGFTPTLLMVVLDKYDLLSEVIGHAIQDRCQMVSPLLAYIFWYITENHRCDLPTKDLHNRVSWFRRKYSCPIHASFEHLLMRYERARMIDLVIANGYTLDWTKRDIHGKTPLDYSKPEFIRLLENHFGVDIQILSDKERLVQLCILDWSYVVLVSYMISGVCVVIGIYILTSCCVFRFL